MYGLNESIVLLIGYVSDSDWSLIAEPKAKQTLNPATDNDPELYFRTVRWTGKFGKAARNRCDCIRSPDSEGSGGNE